MTRPYQDHLDLALHNIGIVSNLNIGEKIGTNSTDGSFYVSTGYLNSIWRRWSQENRFQNLESLDTLVQAIVHGDISIDSESTREGLTRMVNHGMPNLIQTYQNDTEFQENISNLKNQLEKYIHQHQIVPSQPPEAPPHLPSPLPSFPSPALPPPVPRKRCQNRCLFGCF